MERLKQDSFFKHYWWKFVGAFLVLYSVFAGFMVDVPQLPIIEETIRNVFFHVCMWFAMIAIFFYSVIYSILYLVRFDLERDRKAIEAVNVGIVFGILGIVTGMIWAKFTWGTFWVKDPKLNGAAVTMIIYFAYIVLRNSVESKQLKAKLSAVYNIFAFVLLIVFVGILPRIADGSLHPGGGGDSPFAVAKLQSGMYPVFFAAVAGWILVAFWLLDIRVRLKRINDLTTLKN